MKSLLGLLSIALIFAGALIGCSEKEKEQAETNKTADAEPAHPATELIRRKIDLEKQLESIISKADLSGHEELKAAQAKAQEADRHFIAVQRQHPKLQKLFKKAAAWSGRRPSDSPTQRAKAANMMKEIHTKVSKISATLPEIQSALALQKQARKNIHHTRRELADKIPEAKEILNELADIDAQLQAQRP